MTFTAEDVGRTIYMDTGKRWWQFWKPKHVAGVILEVHPIPSTPSHKPGAGKEG